MSTSTILYRHREVGKERENLSWATRPYRDLLDLKEEVWLRVGSHCWTDVLPKLGNFMHVS